MLLADTSAWDAWLTPQGVSAALGLITTMLGLVAMILTLLGKKAVADQLTEAQKQVAAHQAQAQSAVEVLKGVIHAVEEHKKGLDDDAKADLVKTLQTTSTKLGIQPFLAPLVTAVQDGKADTASLLKLLNDTLQSAQVASIQLTASKKDGGT